MSFTKQPSADVDLSAANVAALADLQAELAGASSTPEPVTPPVVEAVAEPTSTPAPAEASEAAATVEVPTPTQPVELDPDAVPDDVEELKKGYLRHRDYTRKTMTLAEERKAAVAEAQRAQAVQAEAQRFYQEAMAWRQVAQDPDALERYAQAQRAALNQPDPDQPLTWAQMQEVRARDAQALRAQMAQEFKEALVAQETARQENQFFGELDAHAQAILDKNPLLKAQPRITRLIVEDARARNPQNPAEFKRFMAEEAEERTKALTKILKDHEQAAIMRHAKTAAPSITPPGGSIPAVQAPTKRLKLGSSELHAQIEQDLLAEMRK
jgi:hypothetical protein